jgi:hypothetical protein
MQGVIILWVVIMFLSLRFDFYLFNAEHVKYTSFMILLFLQVAQIQKEAAERCL